ncbi:cupin domain-containing protein [Rhizobium lusitanum]|uniref:Mannose-6-phosphate isomerase-like protein (Cupin superfamily) n=1 Tax=Rhizobium lusitanum TaxID=293958 RepID=A0A7X0MEF2_9HYPH|nr:cupin domain-containing protein [Rhizobium lusitanum]MBB6487897.1 mannose-6-phosphate isomerase-like protein (cupin superfamily) [Rhizobium lusitanum]
MAEEDKIVFANGKGEFWTDERCYITELHNCDASPEASLAVARVEVGVTTQLHSLTGVIERYIVRQGEGNLEIDGVKQRLQVGDQAVIPAGAAQRIENTGAVDLEFYCLCTPRFFPESYVNLEQ